MGTLSQTLQAHTVIGIDTAIFIYLWERHPRYYRPAETVFRYLKTTSVQGITSLLTLIEVCVYPQRQGRLDLVADYERTLLHSQQVQTVPISVAIARRAVQLRAVYDFHVPDAVQIATALESGATAFITNDRRLTKTQEVNVLMLEDYAE